MMRQNDIHPYLGAGESRYARSAHRRTPRFRLRCAAPRQVRFGLYCRRAPKGVIGVEVVVSLGLLMLLTILSIDAIMQYRRAADEYFWRRAALCAVDGQLQRFRAGAPIDSLPPAGLVPREIALTTQHEPGQGKWQGLTRVTASARVTLARGRVIHEQLSAYMSDEVAR